MSKKVRNRRRIAAKKRAAAAKKSAPAIKNIAPAEQISAPVAEKIVPTVEHAETANDASPAKKKRFTRRTLIKVMFVAAVIFIMISLTYSWFTYSNSASVNGLTINVTDPNNLTASGVTVSGEVNALSGNGTSFFKPVFKDAVTTTFVNGVSVNGYKRVINSYTASGDDVESATADTENLLTVDFSLSINGEYNLYMTQGSEVVPTGDTQFIKGAVRVAVLKFVPDETESETESETETETESETESESETEAETEAGVSGKYVTQLVWIPDVKTYINGGELLESRYKIATGESVGAEQILDIGTKESGTAELDGVTYAWGDIGTDGIPVGTINGEEKYRIVIWLDGNDRECDQSASGGAVEATFKFLPKAISEGSDE